MQHKLGHVYREFRRRRQERAISQSKGLRELFPDPGVQATPDLTDVETSVCHELSNLPHNPLIKRGVNTSVDLKSTTQAYKERKWHINANNETSALRA